MIDDPVEGCVHGIQAPQIQEGRGHSSHPVLIRLDASTGYTMIVDEMAPVATTLPKHLFVRTALGAPRGTHDNSLMVNDYVDDTGMAGYELRRYTVAGPA